MIKGIWPLLSAIVSLCLGVNGNSTPYFFIPVEETPSITQQLDDGSKNFNLVEQDKKPVAYMATTCRLDLRSQGPILLITPELGAWVSRAGTALSHTSLLKSLDFC